MSVGGRNLRIDAMRGVSIVLVLLHHFNIAYSLRETALASVLGWCTVHAVVRNGNYGVTMFFAISGFLITSNARRRWGRLEHVHAGAFWRMRAGRIMPSIVLLLLIVNGLAACGLAMFANTPDQGPAVPMWIVDAASFTFWMNVLMQHVGWVNYVLCALWSLSVEEVFYTAFPVLCLLLRSERRLGLVWAGFIVLGPIWRAMHQDSEYAELNSYLGCFDGIAFGACAALLGERVRLPGWALRPVFGVVAVAMAAFYLWGWIGDTAVYGVTLMASGTAVLLVVMARLGPPGGTVALGWLRACGRLSYELYLFHLVVLALLRTAWPPAQVGAGARLVLLVAFLAGSVLVARGVASWFSGPLERWLRRFRIPATAWRPG